jgi:hypothetical protein
LNSSIPFDSRAYYSVLGAGFFASSIHLLPKDIDAVAFVPFCALIGGAAGAFWHVLFHGFVNFPREESFRGAFLGIVFGIAVIVLGAAHA